MTDEELSKLMVPPGQVRTGIWRGGVIQIMITRACDLSCHHCTQGSNLAGRPAMMTPEQFEMACVSLKGYFGVVGVFGGNPSSSPHFEECCKILRKHFPYEQRGLWCNHARGKGEICRKTFNPAVSNLNVHTKQEAYDEFARDWPESIPFLKGLQQDSRHGSPYVSRTDIGMTPEAIDEGTSTCHVNQLWSAILGVVGGELRAYVCEVMYSLSVLHESDPDWPQTGMIAEPGWWKRPMSDFMHQVRSNCHHCGMPNRSYGQLAVGGDHEEVSKTHQPFYRPKVRDRLVQLVTLPEQIQQGALTRATDYIENGAL